MSQALFFAAVYLLGAMVAFAVGPRRDPLLCCAIAFPVGMASSVLLAMALLVVGLPVTQVSLGVVAGLSLGGAVFVATRRGALDRRALVLMAVWTVALFALTWWVVETTGKHTCPSRVQQCILNRRVANNDEHTLAVLSKVAESRELVLDQLWHRLPKTGFFLLVLRALSEYADVTWGPPLTKVLAASLVALFAVAAWRLLALTGTKVLPRAIAVVALSLVLGKGLHLSWRLFFIDAYLVSSMFLFGFVALWVVAEVRRERSPLWLAVVCLGAFALQTPDSVLPAALVLGIAVFASRLPRAQVAAPLTLFTMIALLWLSFPGSEDKFPEDDQLGMVVFGAVYALWLALGMRSMPRLMPAALAGVLALLGAAWIVDEWRWDPIATRQLLFIHGGPLALLYVACKLTPLVARAARPTEPSAPEPGPPAGVFAPFGGRRRATALLFAMVVTGLLVSNVRLYFRNQRKMSSRYQLFAHDAFLLELAADGVPEPRAEPPP